MENIKEWVLIIAVCAMIVEIFEIIMPQGNMKKTAITVCGLILCLCIIIPVSSMYKDLDNLDFNYSFERDSIAKSKEAYTEDEIIKITEEFKIKLKEHIENRVNRIEGLGKCEAEVIIEENYNSEKYGTIYRIYITAEEISDEMNEEMKERQSSGFSQYGDIKRVVISLKGIEVIRRDEDKEDKNEPENVRVKETKQVISKEFELGEENIFVTVN